MKVCHNLIIVGKPDNPEFTQSMLAACIVLPLQRCCCRWATVSTHPEAFENKELDLEHHSDVGVEQFLTLKLSYYDTTT